MDMNKAGGSNGSGRIAASNMPSLDEADEVRYSKNTPNNELTDSDSDTSLASYRCGEFGSLISKKISYDIYKSYSGYDPVFILASSDNISVYNKPRKPKRVEVANKPVISSVIHRTSTGVQYDVPSDHQIHCSRSNSLCHERKSKIFSKATAQSHTGIPSVKIEKKECAEKTTYCRPIFNNCYNEEFVFKTMEKNKRLKKLVEKLASARETEKQKDAWNNYINELKNKHKFKAGPSSVPVPPLIDHRTHDELIENFYKTRFQCKQSNLCRNLLKDLYVPHITDQNIPQHDYLNLDYGAMTAPKIDQSSNMVLKRNVYAPSYVENKSILNTDILTQGGNQYTSHPVGRHIYSNTIIMDKQYRSKRNRNDNSAVGCKKVFKTSSIQTNFKLLPLKDKKEVTQKVTDKYNIVSENINKIKREIDNAREEHRHDNVREEHRHDNVREEHRHDSLESIESKLDVLIRSLNTLITEIRGKGASRGSSSSSSNNNVITISRSVDAGLPVTEYMFDLTNSVPKVNSIQKVKFVGTSKMNNIIVEETDKSNELKRDIENILNGHVKKSYAIQITDEIPTKEHSTEVTASLYNTGITEEVEEVRRDFNDHSMAIAVNTEPLGWLSLLRISRDAVRNIMSYMPSIPLQNLLPLLQLQRENATPFVCNICGAAFAKSSDLTEHCQSHVENRDCCVCRHLMGIQAQNPRRIFCCEYCGKPFSRAYCCELHQQNCARRLGKIRDVTSSLVLLR